MTDTQRLKDKLTTLHLKGMLAFGADGLDRCRPIAIDAIIEVLQVGKVGGE